MLGNSDSEAEVALKGNKNSKKRKHDDSSDDDEYYDDLKNEVTAKKSWAQDPKKPTKPKTFQELLLAMQKEQIDRHFRKKWTDIFERSERRFQESQKEMLEKQLEAEAKEKDKDREFFL